MCAIAAAAAALVACAHPGKTVRVDETFHGQPVQMRAGDNLEIVLPENASTGYRWTIAPESESSAAPVLREGKQSAEGAGSPPGKPGLRIFRFDAVQSGSVQLLFRYARPWEKDKAPAREFMIQVVVSPG